MCFFVGWAMQTACYIFIDRKWEYDQNRLSGILSYFNDVKVSKPQVFLNIMFCDMYLHHRYKSEILSHSFFLFKALLFHCSSRYFNFMIIKWYLCLCVCAYLCVFMPKVVFIIESITQMCQKILHMVLANLRKICHVFCCKYCSSVNKVSIFCCS